LHTLFLRGVRPALLRPVGVDMPQNTNLNTHLNTTTVACHDATVMPPHCPDSAASNLNQTGLSCIN